MKHIPFIALGLTLAACSQQSDTTNLDPIQVDRVINVNMTYDRAMPHKATAITAVPNNVAPWVSSLFIIDEKNQLLRGALETGDFKLIATNIHDIAPLARKNAAGVIIARTQDNSLKGYIEINDEGDYTDIPFTKTPDTISGFCATSELMEQRIYGFNKTKTYALEILNLPDNARIESVEMNQPPSLPNTCLLDLNDNDIDAVTLPKSAVTARLLDNDTLIFTTQESKTRPRLFINQNDITTAIDITGGLTTEAPTQIDSFTIIHNNLGGVLRNGAILLTDNASERVIYVSLDLLNQRIADAVTLPEQE